MYSEGPPTAPLEGLSAPEGAPPLVVLPQEVSELVLDASCNTTLVLWGNLRSQTPDADGCVGGVNCTATQAPRGASIVFPLILFLTGILGQVLALSYLYRTPRPNTRTVFYVMLSTLLWTDLIGKVLTTPPALVAYLYGHWGGGRNLCHYHGFVMALIGMVTHLLVCAMAIERLLGIRHGYFYNQNVTTNRVKKLLTGLWSFSVVLCSTPLFGLGRFVLQFPGSWCFLDSHLCPGSPLQDTLFTYTYGTINITALVVMAVCNVIVVGTLLKMRVSRAVPSLQGADRLQSIRSHKHKELEIQMVFVLLIITTVFVVSWGPLDILLFANSIWRHTELKDHWVDFVAIRLVSVNQIVNPWAYIICRVAYRSKLCQCCRQALVGRRFSLMEEGKNSFANSLRSLRKLSRGGREESQSDYKREDLLSESSHTSIKRRCSSDNTRSSLASKCLDALDKRTQKNTLNNSIRANYQIVGPDPQLPREIGSENSENLKSVDEINPTASPKSVPLHFDVDEVYGNEVFQPLATASNLELNSEVRLPTKEVSAEQLKNRKVGVANLLLHPLGRVVSNRTLQKIKKGQDLGSSCKRTQSLDGSPGQLLLVVPIETRSRSVQAMLHQGTCPSESSCRVSGQLILPDDASIFCVPKDCEKIFSDTEGLQFKDNDIFFIDDGNLEASNLNSRKSGLNSPIHSAYRSPCRTANACLAKDSSLCGDFNSTAQGSRGNETYPAEIIITEHEKSLRKNADPSVDFCGESNVGCDSGNCKNKNQVNVELSEEIHQFEELATD